MLEEIKDIQKVTETKEVIIARIRRCDICGAVISDTRTLQERKHYWRVTTHDDIIANWKDADVCSVKCLKPIIDEYIELSNNPYSTKIIEIEHINTRRQ